MDCSVLSWTEFRSKLCSQMRRQGPINTRASKAVFSASAQDPSHGPCNQNQRRTCVYSRYAVWPDKAITGFSAARMALDPLSRRDWTGAASDLGGTHQSSARQAGDD